MVPSFEGWYKLVHNAFYLNCKQVFYEAIKLFPNLKFSQDEAV